MAKCRFVPCLLLELFWKPQSLDPITTFRRWVDAYFDELDRVHPLQAANKVALLLRAHYQEHQGLVSLA